jgi:hypothetical protein
MTIKAFNPEFWNAIQKLKEEGLLGRASRIECNGIVLELREQKEEPSNTRELTPEEATRAFEETLYAAS